LLEENFVFIFSNDKSNLVFLHKLKTFRVFGRVTATRGPDSTGLEGQLQQVDWIGWSIGVSLEQQFSAFLDSRTTVLSWFADHN